MKLNITREEIIKVYTNGEKIDFENETDELIKSINMDVLNYVDELTTKLSEIVSANPLLNTNNQLKQIIKSIK